MKSLALMKALVVVVGITIVFGTMYAVAQQTLRWGANDPQIQLAEDAAASIDRGASFDQIVAGQVWIDQSLAPFIQIYNSSGALLAGNAYLGDNQQPVIPGGVLSAASAPYHAVTWQPASGVRLAAVVVKAHNVYVVSGRNLFEIERREDTVLRLVALGWIAAIACQVAWYSTRWCYRHTIKHQ